MNAALHIQVGVSHKASYVQKLYFTTPIKVMDITEDKRSNDLHLMLMSSSPGILDGDVYDIKIEVAANAVLQLHTQAYQRLFQMKGSAMQQMNIYLDRNASFVFLPHPSVPHKQSSFVTQNNFYLHQQSRLVFGEVLTCGRKLNDEVFSFTKYHSLTAVYRNNKLVIKENLLMQPNQINVQAIGQLEGYTHQASLIYLEEAIDMKAVQVLLLELLSVEKNIEFGVSEAPVNGLIVRILGNGAEQLRHCMLRINTLLNDYSYKKLAYAN